MKGIMKVLFAVLISAMVVSCSGLFDEDDKPKSKPQAVPDVVEVESVSTYNFAGRIVDENSNPISDVKILYMGNGASGVTFSDVNGKYRVSEVTVGSYSVTALKAAYTFGEIKFDVTENGAAVPALTLSNLREKEGRKETETTAADIQATGAVVESSSDNDVSTGSGAVETKQKIVKASIPQNTKMQIDGEDVTEEVVLAAAPMDVNEVPPPKEVDEQTFGAAVFEPQGATFDQPVEISVPLEIQLPAGIQIPLKKYENGEWKDMGVATIDETGLGADAGVTEFGQMAIQPKVALENVKDETPEEEVGETVDVPAEQTNYEAEVTDSVDFPGGLPEGVSVDYAISLIEQMKGIQIGKSKTVNVESPLAKTAAKPARVDEEWIITWTVVRQLSVYTESLTLSIDVGSSVLEFLIEYNYTEESLKPVITEKKVLWWIDASVSGAKGVKIAMTGSKTETRTILEDGGSTRFLGDTGDNYTLTPVKNGYDFNPASKIITGIDSDVAQAFTAKEQTGTKTISGTVSDASNVKLTLTGDANDETTTDENGNYSFKVASSLTGLSYTVTPSLDGYTFTPTSAPFTFTNTTDNGTANFTAVLQTTVISGVVNGANDVTVILSDSNGEVDRVTVANAGDPFSFSAPALGNYTLIAEKYTSAGVGVLDENILIAPVNYSLGADSVNRLRSGNDFTASVKQRFVNISGNVVGADNITVTLTGSEPDINGVLQVMTERSVTLNNGGTYSWGVKAKGNYTVTGTAAGNVQFIGPTTESYSNLESDEGLDFVAVELVTLEGNINYAPRGSTTGVNNGQDIAGVSVKLTGNEPGPDGVGTGAAIELEVQSDSSGHYSFENVKAGSIVLVTPSLIDHAFSSDALSEVTKTPGARDFTGTKWVTISVTATGAVDIDVLLIGGLSDKSRTVSSDGSTSFRVIAGFDFIGSAVKEGATFISGASASFAGLTSDATWEIVVHDQGEGGTD